MRLLRRRWLGNDGRRKTQRRRCCGAHDADFERRFSRRNDIAVVDRGREDSIPVDERAMGAFQVVQAARIGIAAQCKMDARQVTVLRQGKIGPFRAIGIRLGIVERTAMKWLLRVSLAF